MNITSKDALKVIKEHSRFDMPIKILDVGINGEKDKMWQMPIEPFIFAIEKDLENYEKLKSLIRSKLENAQIDYKRHIEEDSNKIKTNILMTSLHGQIEAYTDLLAVIEMLEDK